MKILAIPALFALLAVGAFAQPAFADHAEAVVDTPEGSSVTGCQDTDTCFIPSSVSIDVGGEVTWTNSDIAAHTVTSGTINTGPDGLFDSGLQLPDTTYSFVFDVEPGTYPYFCLVHPWMSGAVTVVGAMDDHGHMMEGTITSTEGLEDGTEFSIPYTISGGEVTGAAVSMDDISITLQIDAAEDGEVTFKPSEEVISGVYVVLVDGAEADNVTIMENDVTVPFAAGTSEIELIGTSVIPEFGTVAMIILGVAITSIIAITARSRIVPRV